MDELLKKKVQNIVLESLEMDEMADWKKMYGQTKEWEPIMSEPQGREGENDYIARGQEFLKGKSKGELKGHRLIDKSTGDEIALLYPCNAEIDQFIETHKSLIEALKEKFGDVYFKDQPDVPCRQPRVRSGKLTTVTNIDTRQPKDIDIRYTPSGESYADQERIKRYGLFPTINNYFGSGSPEVSEHLDKCNIPVIIPTERSHLNRHSEISNYKITYETLTFNSYKSNEDFYDAAIRRITGGELEGEEEEFRRYHLARQFNKIYAKWGPDRKNDKWWEGLTDVYGLEKFGLAEQNFDVTVSSRLTINGVINPQAQTYTWTGKFVVSHGRKLAEDRRLRGMNTDYEFDSVKNVDYSRADGRTVDFTDSYTVLDDTEIYSGLQELCQDLKDKILSIEQRETLKRANLHQYHLDEMMDINEAVYHKITKNILRELKK